MLEGNVVFIILTNPMRHIFTNFGAKNASLNLMQQTVTDPVLTLAGSVPVIGAPLLGYLGCNR
jgi:hypothetical protein